VTSGHPRGGFALREVIGWWTWDPLVIAVLAGASFLYARGVVALWTRVGRDRGITRTRVICFAAAMLTLALALLSPLDRLSDSLFSAHMTQHQILMSVAAPLLVLGRPLHVYLWGLPAETRARVTVWTRVREARTAIRTATHPLLVLFVQAVVMWVLHLPYLFELALRNEIFHAVQHLLFFSTSVLFFWAVVHGRYGRSGYGVSVFFVFAAAMHTSVLGALFTLGKVIAYPIHAGRTELLQLEPLEDQQLAGLIMWIPGGMALVVVGLSLFAAWIGEAERRIARSRFR
jgi:putative membrane protein